VPKTVVVGVSGGIAAYKSAYLTSLLKKKGYEVHLILTENALKFVSALTFETLSGNAAVTDTFERTDTFDVKHVSLAKKADMFIIAPATADVIGKVASGIADDMLTTTLLAAECPVVFAPAMNTAMYQSPVVQSNISILKKRGYHVMDTGEGFLACGDTGQGRMKEPEEILEYIESIFSSLYDMHGIKVLISAGPTKEMIDPVRFLSNSSSGKMGYATARAALDRGADVTLVSGPVSIESPAKAGLINVVSANDMYDAIMPLSERSDIIIMTAAVTDYSPVKYSEQKIKKRDDLTLQLIKTKDILKALGERKKSGQVLIGFAAETQDFDSNAIGKLQSKNLDMIALNDISRKGEGFGSDSNNIKLFFRDGRKIDLGSGNKSYLAKRLIEEAYELHKSLR
jgi:phosphopantothenoylcysteine decarboxylase / phosphopantothenate---cysteine ligase